MTSRFIDQPPDHAVGSLARKGVAWSAALIVSRQLIGILVTSVLARLLLPGDYGVMAMAGTLIALLSAFGDMGLSSATVQRKKLTLAQTHNLFWINFAVGIALCLACAVTAPLLAEFYGEKRLVPVTLVLAVSFAMSGAAVQPTALMRRQLQFRSLSLIQFAQFLIGSGVAIGAAFLGAGYWALVAQAIAAQVVRIGLVVRVSGYRPGRFRRGAGTVEMLRFGGFLTGSGLLIYFQRNLDNVLIGRFLGPEELGYYTRAYFLMMLPTVLAAGTLSSVMVPSLAALQDDLDRLASAYRRAVRWICIVSFPIGAGLVLVADEAVRLVYGERWLAMSPILAWLSVVSLTQPIFNTYGWLFTATGKGRAYFTTSLAVTVVLVAAFAVGVQQGAVGVAGAYALVMTIVVTGPTLYAAHRAANIPFLPTVRIIMPSALACGVMMAGVWLASSMMDREGVVWQNAMMIKIVLGAILYCSSLYLSDRAIRAEFRAAWNRFILRQSST